MLIRRANFSGSFDALRKRDSYQLGMSRFTHFARECSVVVSAQQAYDWHSRSGAFTRLIPPWEQVHVQKIMGSFGVGQQIEMRTKIFGPLWGKWLAEITQAVRGGHFTDVQHHGPFSYWQHRHEFRPLDEHRSIVSDQIEYRLPMGKLGRWLGGRFVRKKLERMFAYRHRVTQNDLFWYARFQNQPRLRVVVTGSSGLIGSQLVALLTSQGHEVCRLVRKKSRLAPMDSTQEILWNPLAPLPAETWSGIDLLIHLAGESVAEGRWSSRKKQRIRDSRIAPTRLLAESFGAAKKDRGTLICASAVGYYGDRRDEILTENSPPAENDFLAQVVRDWESATFPAQQQGTRVVNARFGVVLSPAGGALKKQLLPFRLGLGGRLGTGAAYFPWVCLDDLLYGLLFVAHTPSVSGPINVVAPQELTNRQWTSALGQALHRPTIFPIPPLALKLLFGEMATVLLASQRVQPHKLLQAGFEFRYPTIEQALNHLFGNPSAEFTNMSVIPIR